MNDAIKLATEVFTNEQNIPADSISIDGNLRPIWWCARVGEDIIGVAAAWKEKDKWKWGRFAVDKRLRGFGIGQKIAAYSLKEIFSQYTDKLYIEARDVTVNMLTKFGCKVIGEVEYFYGDTITPIVLKKEFFDESFTSQCLTL